MELEAPQQKHKRLVPRCKPNIEKESAMVTNESRKIILHQLLPK